MNKIKEMRNSKKITQKELAKRMGKSERMIQKYENSEAGLSINVLNDISKALDVPVSSLYTDLKEDSLSYKLLLEIESEIHNLGIYTKDLYGFAFYLMRDFEMDSSESIVEVLINKDCNLSHDIYIKALSYLKTLNKDRYLEFCYRNDLLDVETIREIEALKVKALLDLTAAIGIDEFKRLNKNNLIEIVNNGLLENVLTKLMELEFFKNQLESKNKLKKINELSEEKNNG